MVDVLEFSSNNNLLVLYWIITPLLVSKLLFRVILFSVLLNCFVVQWFMKRNKKNYFIYLIGALLIYVACVCGILIINGQFAKLYLLYWTAPIVYLLILNVCVFVLKGRKLLYG